MLTVISPAKTLDYETPSITNRSSTPSLLDQSELLIDTLRGYSAPKLSKLMSISDKLGELNRRRYASWELPLTDSNSKQALLAFKGDVYRGLEAETLSDEDLRFAQKHLRILSGLYGVLRPLDLMLPYRLEMGTKLSTERGKNLYEFWGHRITSDLNKQLRATKSSTLINLASVEYFKSIDLAQLNADVVSPVFLDEKNDTFKIISFYAKKARGVMSGWIIRKHLLNPRDLKKYRGDGYRYSADLSSPGTPTFIRSRVKK